MYIEINIYIYWRYRYIQDGASQIFLDLHTPALCAREAIGYQGCHWLQSVFLVDLVPASLIIASSYHWCVLCPFFFQLSRITNELMDDTTDQLPHLQTPLLLKEHQFPLGTARSGRCSPSYLVQAKNETTRQLACQRTEWSEAHEGKTNPCAPTTIRPPPGYVWFALPQSSRQAREATSS